MLPGRDIFGKTQVLSNLPDLHQATPFNKAETLLGEETDCVIYDVFSGMNIDVLCMAVGLIRAGGMLILLTPENLQEIDDKYGRWQNRETRNPYFIRYLYREMGNDRAVVNIKRSLPRGRFINPAYSPLTAIQHGLGEQQHQLIEALQQWVEDKSRPLFFLTADRGRGKSTTLGIWANRLKEPITLVITAASKTQAAILQGRLNEKDYLFIAPDEIIRRQQRMDCLIIDEAAMIPFNMLRQCVRLSDKTVLATTTGGYEGTGQGFLIKFLAAFNPDEYIHRWLHHPMRWGHEDQLERWMNRVLMFSAPHPVKKSTVEGILIQQLNKQYLAENVQDLKAIYGLLISAHYRTRPSDLRQLMEDENQSLFIARVKGDIVGVLLLNEEGGFNAELTHDVFIGKRRPQGHLFAQMMTAQAGLKNFARLRGYRVQRITVSEEYRRNGIGRLLMEEASRVVKKRDMGYLASVFALDHATAPFWKNLGFDLVHIGSGKGKSTGRQAVAVIRPVTREAKSSVAELGRKTHDYLPVWLSGYCQGMMWRDVLSLLDLAALEYKLTHLDEDEIEAFATGFRGLDLSIGPLQRLIISQLPKMEGMDEDQSQLLVERILLNKSRSLFAENTQFKGKKEMTRHIRMSILKLYEQYRGAAYEP